ncbi:MAG TPA: hypothetical protein VK302_10585 [Terriglobales bacterium]|nr:hypothetical protein [Terriglobales bacterium]
MPQTCKICRHIQRDEIEQAMLRKVSCRRIATLFQVSPSAVSRHRSHTSEQFLGAGVLAKPVKNEDSEVLRAIDKLLAEIHLLQRRLRQGRQRNTVQGADMILKVSRELRCLVELRERLAGPRVSTAQPAKEQALDDDAELLSEDEAVQIAKKFLASRGDVPKTPVQRGSQVAENEQGVSGESALSKSFDFGTVGAR